MLLSPERLHCDSKPLQLQQHQVPAEVSLPTTWTWTALLPPPPTSSFWLTPYRPSKACSGISHCSTFERLNTFLPLWSPWVNYLCLKCELQDGTHHVYLGPCYLLCLVECLTCTHTHTHTHTHKFLGKTKINFSRLPFKHISIIKCATLHCNCEFVFLFEEGYCVLRITLTQKQYAWQEKSWKRSVKWTNTFSHSFHLWPFIVWIVIVGTNEVTKLKGL